MKVYVAVIPNDYRYAIVEIFGNKPEAQDYLKEECENGQDVSNAVIHAHDITFPDISALLTKWRERLKRFQENPGIVKDMDHVTASGVQHGRMSALSDCIRELAALDESELQSLCPGCGRPELHKMCPAHGTPFYMSGITYTEQIAALCKILDLDHQKSLFDIVSNPPLRSLMGRDELLGEVDGSYQIPKNNESSLEQ